MKGEMNGKQARIPLTDDYYCSPTADSLFKNGPSVPRKAGRPHWKR